MVFPSLGAVPIALVVVLALVTAAVNILREYECAVVFMLGRLQRVKAPGLVPDRQGYSARNVWMGP